MKATVTLALLLTAILSVLLTGCNDSVSQRFAELSPPTASLKVQLQTQASGDGIVYIRGGSQIEVELQPIVTSPKTLLRHRLELSLDDGDFTSLGDIAVDARSFVWSVPAKDRSRARLRYVAIDNFNGQASQLSPIYVILASNPALTLVAPPALSNQANLSLAGNCQSDFNQTVALSVQGSPAVASQSLVCNSGHWSASLKLPADGSFLLKVSQSDPAGNTATASATVLLDTQAPTIATFTVNNGNATSLSRFPQLVVKASDAATPIVRIAYGYRVGSCGTPAPADLTQVAVPDATLPGTAANQRSLSTQFFATVGLGAIGSLHCFSFYVQDAAGNWSTVKQGQFVLQSVAPPELFNLVATNDSHVTSYPTTAQRNFSTGAPLYLHYATGHATGTTIVASSIKFSFSTDGETYQALSHLGGNCTPITGATTCIVGSAASFPGGVYPSGAFVIRGQLTDSEGRTAFGSSPLLNGGGFDIVAGNLDANIEAGILSAVPRPDVFRANSMALASDGTLFVMQPKGLYYATDKSGVFQLLAANTGTVSGDGQAVRGATFNRAMTIALSPEDNLFVFDGSVIRRIAYQPGTDPLDAVITTVAGGGSNTADSVAALDLKISPMALTNSAPFAALPGKKLLFTAELRNSTEAQARVLDLANGRVTTLRLAADAVGFQGHPTDPTHCLGQGRNATRPCYFTDFIPRGFDTNTGAFTMMSLTIQQALDASSAWYDGNARVSDGEPVAPFSTFAGGTSVLGQNGQLYRFDGFNGRILHYDAPTNAWVRVVGNGRGHSPDGTAALTAKIQPLDMFVSRDGLIYFIDSIGPQIRFVDESGNLRTFAGLAPSSGDGRLASSGRFQHIRTIVPGRTSGELLAADWQTYRIRSVVRGGAIDTLAGLDYNAAPAFDKDSRTQPLQFEGSGSFSDTLLTDPVDGKIYTTIGNKIGRLDTNAGVPSWTNTGAALPSSYIPELLGVNDGHLLGTSMNYDYSIPGFVNVFIRQLDLSAPTVASVPFLGTGSYANVCSVDGTLAAQCIVNQFYGSMGTALNYLPATWDAVDQRWLIATNSGRTWIGVGEVGGPEESAGRPVHRLPDFPKAPSAYAFRRDGSGKRIAYYCEAGDPRSNVNAGRLHRWEMDTVPVADTLIAMPAPFIACKDRTILQQVIGSQVRLTFPVMQRNTGIEGIGEVLLDAGQ